MCGLLEMKRNFASGKGIIVDFPTAQRFGGAQVIATPSENPSAPNVILT